MSQPVHQVRNQLQRSAYLAGVGMVTLGLSIWAMMPTPPAEARLGPGVHPVVLPNLKYLGNPSCAGSNCHSADKAKEQTGQLIGDENNIWDAGDPHSLAFDAIEMDYVAPDRFGGVKVADMAKKLGIADTATSARCLSCHATNVPEPQRGEKFRIQVGVGCEACHGPAEMWNDPHQKAGWTLAERKKIGAKGLLEKHGLIDTTHLGVRANTCVACHLQIEKELVDAGHPPLKYDHYTYNTITYRFWGYFINKEVNGGADFTHWKYQGGIPFAAKLWATGIAASHESAKANLKQWNAKAGDGSPAADLFDWYTAALAVVKKHFGADTAEKLGDPSFAITPVAAKAAAAELAAMAPNAKSAAARWGIAQGIAALGDIYSNGDDAFWGGYNDASEKAAAGGADYLAAIRKMAEKVK